MRLLLIVLYPVSLLPLRLLYLLSDIACFLLFYVFRYRREVVLDNLRTAFPNKSSSELHTISRCFFKAFCDHWIETLKLLTITEKELNGRIEANWEVFDELNSKGLNCYAVVGHMFNWEWLNVAWQYNVKQQYACIYSPVSNKAFDDLMYKIRSRSGTWLISMKAKRGLQRLKGVRFILGLAADQAPSDYKNAAWLPFFGKETAFFKGPDKLSRKDGAAVVFVSMVKQQRGHYNLHFSLITENAALLPEGEITQRYVQFLETSITAQPHNWLWSHRRWKHSRG